MHCKKLAFGKEFLAKTSEAQATKTKEDKWTYTQPSSFCTAKKHEMKRHPIEREKIFASHASNKRLIFKIYKGLKKITKK